MTIIRIQGLDALLSDGSAVDVREIKGSPRGGCQVEMDENGTYHVTSNNVDPDCVGGVCPVR